MGGLVLDNTKMHSSTEIKTKGVYFMVCDGQIQESVLCCNRGDGGGLFSLVRNFLGIFMYGSLLLLGVLKIQCVRSKVVSAFGRGWKKCWGVAWNLPQQPQTSRNYDAS